MRVILKDDVVGLGDIGQTVNVKPGYGRNFLIPQGKAIEAGSKNAAVVAHYQKAIEKKKKALKIAGEQEAEKLRNVDLVLDLRVASGGKVFGSVTSRMIAEELKKQGFEIDRRRVLLGEPIKKIGVHFVNVKLHSEVKAQLKVVVNEKAAEKEEEEQEALEAKARIESKVENAQAESSTVEPESDISPDISPESSEVDAV